MRAVLSVRPNITCHGGYPIKWKLPASAGYINEMSDWELVIGLGIG